MKPPIVVIQKPVIPGCPIEINISASFKLAELPIVRGLIDYEGAMKIIRDLDKISFKEWFLNHGGSEKSLERMWDPIAYALGFINCKDILINKFI